MIDRAEREIGEKLEYPSVSMDPTVMATETDAAEQAMKDFLAGIDPEPKLHDFDVCREKSRSIWF